MPDAFSARLFYFDTAKLNTCCKMKHFPRLPRCSNDLQFENLGHPVWWHIFQKLAIFPGSSGSVDARLAASL